MTLGPPAYDFRAAIGGWPTGFRFGRDSAALRDDGGRWLPVPPDRPVFEPRGLRIAGARPLLAADPTVSPYDGWLGVEHFAYGEARSAVDRSPAVRWSHTTVLEAVDPGRWLPAPGSGTASHVLAAIVERLDAPSAAIGIRRGGDWLRLVDGGDVSRDIGGGWAMRRSRGTGPNGGALEELALSQDRADGDELWVLPCGRGASDVSAIVHHAQYGPDGHWAGYGLAPIAEETAAAPLAGLPVTAAVEAVAPMGDDGRRVLWQADDGTEGTRITVMLSFGALSLEVTRSTLVMGRLALGTLAPAQAFRVAVACDGTTALCSRDGGAAQSLALAAPPLVATERWGGASFPFAAWDGWLARVRRWPAMASPAELAGL